MFNFCYIPNLTESLSEEHCLLLMRKWLQHYNKNNENGSITQTLVIVEQDLSQPNTIIHDILESVDMPNTCLPIKVETIADDVGYFHDMYMYTFGNYCVCILHNFRKNLPMFNEVKTVAEAVSVNKPKVISSVNSKVTNIETARRVRDREKRR